MVGRQKRPLSRIPALLAGIVLACSAATATAQTTARPQDGVAAPGGAARNDYRSQNFYIHTDLTAPEAKELLQRLETMLVLIVQYWGRPPNGIIECYVIKDLKNWPLGTLPDEDGRLMVQGGGGVTISQILGDTGKSIVYAGADHGTPQHEAVHAYCHQNFGTSGPTWYSEGMAELGQYFRKGDKSVLVHDVVIDYIRKSEPKSLNSIVNGNERTGDSWQNYAWRWALCHLLETNPNYTKQFRPLGLGILTRKPVSFEQTYGAVADQVSFEYLFFLQHVCNGYRCDLAYWDWSRKFTAMPAGTTRQARIAANRGYQPIGVLVKPDLEYTITASGVWKPDPTQTKGVTADGDDKGVGKLVGVLFKDFQLSDEFELGADAKFKPPSEGQLHVRCREDWGKIGDNTGTIDLKIVLPK